MICYTTEHVQIKYTRFHIKKVDISPDEEEMGATKEYIDNLICSFDQMTFGISVLSCVTLQIKIICLKKV